MQDLLNDLKKDRCRLCSKTDVSLIINSCSNGTGLHDWREFWLYVASDVPGKVFLLAPPWRVVPLRRQLLTDFYAERKVSKTSVPTE